MAAFVEPVNSKFHERKRWTAVEKDQMYEGPKGFFRVTKIDAEFHIVHFKYIDHDRNVNYSRTLKKFAHEVIKGNFTPVEPPVIGDVYTWEDGMDYIVTLAGAERLFNVTLSSRTQRPMLEKLERLNTDYVLVTAEERVDDARRRMTVHEVGGIFEGDGKYYYVLGKQALVFQKHKRTVKVNWKWDATLKKLELANDDMQELLSAEYNQRYYVGPDGTIITIGFAMADGVIYVRSSGRTLASRRREIPLHEFVATYKRGVNAGDSYMKWFTDYDSDDDDDEEGVRTQSFIYVLSTMSGRYQYLRMEPGGHTDFGDFGEDEIESLQPPNDIPWGPDLLTDLMAIGETWKKKRSARDRGGRGAARMPRVRIKGIISYETGQFIQYWKLGGERGLETALGRPVTLELYTFLEKYELS